MTTVTRKYLAELIGNDSYAATFQSLGQYRQALLNEIDQASAAPEQEAVEIDWPEFNEQGMGCGLEDRGITDRYEAMRYGYEEALNQAAQVIEGMGPLFTHADPSEVERLRAELESRFTVEEHERLVAKGQELNSAYISKLEQKLAEAQSLLHDWYPGCGLTARQTMALRERTDALLSATAQSAEVKS